MNIDELRRDIEDLLPDNSAFILVVTEPGQETDPTFIFNFDPRHAIESMRTIVQAMDRRDSMGLN